MTAILRRTLLCFILTLTSGVPFNGITKATADTIEEEPELIQWRMFKMRPVRGEGVTDTVVEQITQYIDALLSIDSRYVRLTRSEFEGEVQGEPEPEPVPVLKKDKDLERADELLEKARDLVGKGPKKFRRASKLFQKVIAIYARRFHRMEDFTLMTEVLYESSNVFDALRQRSNLRKVLKWLYTLRPDTIYDARFASKSLIEAAKAEQERVKATPGGKVVITTSPSNARIFVDGIDYGTSPVEVDVPVGGQHFVVAQLQGHIPNGKRVRIKKSRKAKRVKLRLKEIPRPKVKKRVVRKIKVSEVSPLITSGRFNRPTMNMLMRMCSQSKADVVLISHVGALSDQYIYSPFLYIRKEKKLLKVKPTMLPKSLATLQVSLLTMPERLAEVIQNPKGHKAVKGKPQAWKIKPPPPKPLPPPTPVVAVPTPPAVVVPAPTKPAPQATPTPTPPAKPAAPVAKPAPAATPAPAPVVAPPTEVAAAPVTTTNIIAAPDERPGLAMPAIFKEWWFWTGAAVIVGGGVTTAIILSQDSGFNTVVRW